MRPKKHLSDRKGLGNDLKQISSKMEEKLNQLKSLMQKQKQDRELKSTQRWSSKNTTQNVQSTAKTTKSIALEPQTQALHDFLSSVNLIQYEDKPFKAGVDSLDILKQMNKHHMEEIGIAKGHIVKIIKYLGNAESTRPQTAISKPPQPQLIKQTKIQDHAIKETEVPKRPVTATCFEDCQTQSLPIPQHKPKKFCQKCYQSFDQKLRDNNFCSENCQALYKKQNYVLCSKCKKQQQKWDCFKAEDQYYCSEECMKEVLEQIQRQEAILNAEKEEDIYYQLDQEVLDQDINLNEFLEIQKYLKD